MTITLHGLDSLERLRFSTDGPLVAVSRPEVRAAHNLLVRTGRQVRLAGNVVDESDLLLLLLELTKATQARHAEQAGA